VKAAGLPLSSLAFRPALKKKINEFVFDSDEAKMLEERMQGSETSLRKSSHSSFVTCKIRR
jgi:hypothetical protein